VLAATLFAHESAAFGVHVSAGLGDDAGWRGLAGVAGCLGSGRGVAGCAEQGGERGDCLEEQCVDAGLLVGCSAGAELGDGAAVLGVGGELAYPGGDGRGHVGDRAVWRGVVSRG